MGAADHRINVRSAGGGENARGGRGDPEKGGRTSIPRLPKHFETKKKKVQVAPIAAPAPVEVVPSAAIEKPPVIAALEKMANDLSAMANLLFESIGNIESRIGRIEVAMTANTKEDK